MNVFSNSFFLILIILFLAFNDASAEITIIANKNVPVDSYTKSEIKDIFLGKIRKYPDKSDIIIYLLWKPDQEEFLHKFIHRSADQYHRYWLNQLFIGEANYPIKFRHSEKLMEYVAKTPGAIGFINEKLNTESVKIITVK